MKLSTKVLALAPVAQAIGQRLALLVALLALLALVGAGMSRALPVSGLAGMQIVTTNGTIRIGGQAATNGDIYVGGGNGCHEKHEKGAGHGGGQAATNGGIRINTLAATNGQIHVGG